MPTRIAIVAVAVSLGLLVAAWLVRAREADVGRRALVGQLLAALAGPAALFAAFLGAGKTTSFPPATYQDWILTGAGAAVVLGLLAGGGVGRRVLVVGAAAGGAFLVFTRGTESLHEHDWEGRVTAWSVGLTAVTVVAVLARLGAGRSAGPARAVEGLLAFALAAIAASPVFFDAGLSVGAIAAAALSGGAGLFGLFLVASARFGGPDRLTGVPGLARAAGVSQAICLCLLVAWALLFTYEPPPAWACAALVLAPLLTLLPLGDALPAALVRLTLVALVAGAAPAWPFIAERLAPPAEDAAEDDSPASYYR